MTLDEWLNTHELTNKWLSEALPACPISVSRWRGHKILPRPETMRRIAAVTGGAVQPADWYRPAPVRKTGFPKGRRRTQQPAGAVS